MGDRFSIKEFMRATRRLSDEERVAHFDALPAWMRHDLLHVNGTDPAKQEEQVKLRSGADFILESPSVEAVWGRGNSVLWSAGEPLLIVAGEGIGKSSIAQQLALCRCGIWEAELFDYPIEVDAGRVLYIAADRPRQIARSFSRMVSEEQRDQLEQTLVISEDVPTPLSADPDAIVPWLDSIPEIGTVFIDSLKDVADDLASPAEAQRVARSFKNIIHSGRELVVLHHDRKADAMQSDKRRPRLADVFGSKWLTAACGSVWYLEGESGVARFTAHHLRPPLTRVGPLPLFHKYREGRTIIDPEGPIDKLKRAEDPW